MSDKIKKPLFKRISFWVLIIAVVLIGSCVASLGGGSGTKADTPAGTTAAPADAEAVVGVGDVLTVEDKTLKVISVAAPVTEVGTDITEQANGEFIVLDIEVSNNSNKEWLFSADTVKLLSGEVEYSPEDMINLYLDNGIAYDALNPGVTVSGQIVFDVPVGTEFDHVQFEPDFMSFGDPGLISLK